MKKRFLGILGTILGGIIVVIVGLYLEYRTGWFQDRTPTATASVTSPGIYTPIVEYESTPAQEEKWIDKGSSQSFFDGQLLISLQEVSADGEVRAAIRSPTHPDAEISDAVLGDATYYQADSLYEIRIVLVAEKRDGATFLVIRLPAPDPPRPDTSTAPTDTPTPLRTVASPLPTRSPTSTAVHEPPIATGTRPLPTSPPPSPTPSTAVPTSTPLRPTNTPSPTTTSPPAFAFAWDTQATCANIQNRVNNLSSVDVQVTGYIMAQPDGGAEQQISEVPVQYQNCPPEGWSGPMTKICEHYAEFQGVVWGTTWVHYQGAEVASHSFGPTSLSCGP